MQRLAETHSHSNQHGQITLRDYQQSALDAIASARANGLARVLVQLPTGAGKTVVFAHLIKQFLAESPRP